MKNIRIVLEETDTGWSGYSPDVPGVGVTGPTREEAEAVLRDAITFHAEGLVLESLIFSGGGSSFMRVNTLAAPSELLNFHQDVPAFFRPDRVSAV